MWEARVQDKRLMMAEPHSPFTSDESQPKPHSGPEQRSGTERRQKRDPEPPPEHGERRTRVRRKADRLRIETTALGAGGRVHRRVHIEVPVLCRPLAPSSVPDQPPRRGITSTLAPGGLAMLLEEEFRVGTPMEVLIRFGGDLLAADVEVVSVLAQSGKFLHNCRFARLGTADRDWLTEYLRIRNAPPA